MFKDGNSLPNEPPRRVTLVPHAGGLDLSTGDETSAEERTSTVTELRERSTDNRQTDAPNCPTVLIEVAAVVQASHAETDRLLKWHRACSG